MGSSPYLPPSPFTKQSPSRAGKSAGTGSVVECSGCGYVWVLKRSAVEDAACRRCGDTHVAKWRPGPA